MTRPQVVYIIDPKSSVGSGVGLPLDERLSERIAEMKTSCIAISLVFLFAVAHAQTTASLTGVVTDPSGAVVPGADIVVVNPETNAQRAASAT